LYESILDQNKPFWEVVFGKKEGSGEISVVGMKKYVYLQPKIL
jgi:hypothetical protein